METPILQTDVSELPSDYMIQQAFLNGIHIKAMLSKILSNQAIMVTHLEDGDKTSHAGQIPLRKIPLRELTKKKKFMLHPKTKDLPYQVH